MSTGPVEYVILNSRGNKFKGEIIPALGELVESNTIRIIDLVFIYKDEEGNVAAMELEEVDDEGAKSMDDIADAGGLLNDEDIEIAADGLENNSSGAVMLFENVWAAKFVEAVRNADGELVANERIPYEIVEAARADLVANPD
jgi:Family of unknown function (DUF6325)